MFVFLSTGPRVGFAGRLHGNGPQLYFENGGSTGQIRGFDPWVCRKQLAGHDGLTRE